jgi:hypothetical protein
MTFETQDEGERAVKFQGNKIEPLRTVTPRERNAVA